MLESKLQSAAATATETTATSGNIIMTKLSAAGQFAWNVIKGIGMVAVPNLMSGPPNETFAACCFFSNGFMK